MQRRNIIIHGHFYQPPREDPWTGIIERQESAAPFTDWNSRITAECYAACAYSRVLDGEGAIDAILNNYRYMSFNFGPTLLAWLEGNAPNVYQRIIDADRESLRRLGFGNAVAQSYNHTILPLDDDDDARTQIRWGLADFEYRFGRKADGMWLPECAASGRILDFLIAEGMRYIILSPWQAASIENNRGVLEDLGEKPAPSSECFRITRSGGEIAAFFYDPDLASSISFGHLLQSREGLEAALRAALDNNRASLVTVATDGEVYGHHEPFGDMCLSSLVDSLGDESDLVFTNFAAYLNEYPPVRRAELRDGDDGQGTSWSCSHGVGRWMRDCGCRTGGEEGWNQEWRGPLRKAFGNLRDSCRAIWESAVEEITGKNPRKILNDYGAVVAGASTPEEFLEQAGLGSASRTARENLLRNLEGAKFLQFMYTSCGWFFSELSGIETLQNLRYAYRAAELLEPENGRNLTEALSKDLETAKSNLNEAGSGSDLLRKEAAPAIPAEVCASGLVFWRHLYNLPGRSFSRWGAWKGEGLTRHIVSVSGGRLVLKGRIKYSEPATLRRFDLPYQTVVDRELFCPTIKIQYGGRWIEVNIRTMPFALRREISKVLRRRSDEKLMKFMAAQFPGRVRDHQIVEALDLPYGVSGWQSLELAVHYGPLLVLDKLGRKPLEQWPPLVESLDRMLTAGVRVGLDFEVGLIKRRAGNLVTRVAESLRGQGGQKDLEHFLQLLEALREHGMAPIRPQIQNTFFAMLAEEKDPPHRLRELARALNINPRRFL